MILYYISESFKAFKRAKFASLITIVTTSFAILLTAFSLMLIFMSSQISEKLKSQVEINVFLTDTAGTSIINEMKIYFQKDDRIGYAKFVSKDEAVEKFIRETGEDFRSVLEVNPLPASFTLRLKPKYVESINLDNLIDELKNMTGVEDVVYDYRTTLKLLDILNSSDIFIYVVSILLTLLSIYFVYSNNKLQILARTDQINSMKLVGAKLSTIKFPIIINGILLGIISSLICIILYNIILIVLTKIFISVTFTNILYLFNFLLFLLGVLFGFIGSILSVFKISLKIEKI